MFLKDNTQTKVLLPERLWKEATSKEHFKTLLAEYMKSYPDYIVKRIEKPYAVCERR